MGCFDYFKYAFAIKLTFDASVVDPPSFARFKKTTLALLKDYANLLERVIQLELKPKGIIFLKQCSQCNDW